jgi:ABC-2 type transport system permease protein
MNNKQLGIAFFGLVRKETLRWLRIWPQTLLPSLITSMLYFLIFGQVLGDRIGSLSQLPYIRFIAPGLVMMLLITNSYANVASSFFSERFGRSIEQVFMSPMPNWLIILGYASGGALRGIATGLFSFFIAVALAGLHAAHPWLILVIFLLCSSLFALAGFLNGMLARTFDDTSVFITFVLTPLVYLGGIFYEVKELPTFWYNVSTINPIYYIVSLFRYATLDVGEQTTWISLSIISGLIVILFGLCWHLLSIGFRVKN